MFGSCAKSGSSHPAGTSVTYEVSSTYDTIYVISYSNATESAETYSYQLNNWSLSFQTTKDDQMIHLSASALDRYEPPTETVTGKIYIDGTLEKQATGYTVSLMYP